MTDTRDLLMGAVLDNPADNHARLVLADWLDEFGGTPAARARAELIRVGVELAGTPDTVRQVTGEPPNDVIGRFANPDHARLTARVEAILKRWGRRFLPRTDRDGQRLLGVRGDTAFGTPPPDYARFARGFIGSVGVELPWRADDLAPAAERCGRHLRTLLAANPLTEATVTVEGCTPDVRFRVEAMPDREYPWELWAVVDPAGMFDTRALRVFPTRHEMLRDLPAVVSQVIHDTEFVRVGDDDEARNGWEYGPGNSEYDT